MLLFHLICRKIPQNGYIETILYIVSTDNVILFLCFWNEITGELTFLLKTFVIIRIAIRESKSYQTVYDYKTNVCLCQSRRR